MVIDHIREINYGRYRHGFDEYIIKWHVVNCFSTTMTSSEIEHKKRLVELANVIRCKYNAVKRGEEKFKMKMEYKFQQLINEVQPSSSSSPFPTKIQPTALKKEENASLEKLKDESMDYISANSEHEEEENIVSEDTIFGLTRRKGNYYLDKVLVQVRKNVVTIYDEEYSLTPGLLALLIQKLPDGYNGEDLEMYKAMLLQTNAHKTTSGAMKSLVY